jgi:putative ABC transport system ATP-binding protein
MIHLRCVTKTYGTPAGPFTALNQVDLDVGAGEMLAVTGKSASGKSTLLNLIGGIDRATAGDVTVAAASLQRASERELTRWRGATVGVVFQFFQLLPTLTVAENVMLPMDFLRARPVKTRRRHALDLLARVGLADQADKLPATLSGGQQQRVAIARALANDPPVVTADEPTGNLDSETAAAVLELFRALAAGGTTVVIATHERDISRLATRTVALSDGRVVEDGAAPGRPGAPA